MTQTEAEQRAGKKTRARAVRANKSQALLRAKLAIYAKDELQASNDEIGKLFDISDTSTVYQFLWRARKRIEESGDEG